MDIEKLAKWMDGHGGVIIRDGQIAILGTETENVDFMYIGKSGAFIGERWNPEENIAHAFMLLDRVIELYPRCSIRLEYNDTERVWKCGLADYSGGLANPFWGEKSEKRETTICNAILQLIEGTSDE